MISTVKKIIDHKQLVVVLISALLLIFVCIFYLDAKVALSIKGFLQANPALKNRVRYIPNLLPTVVCIATVALWITYLSRRTSIDAIHARFLKLTAIVVPVSYLAKMFLQYTFGRTYIRYWLNKGGPIEFNWFTPLVKFPCFPSGHMTVFTAFCTSVWFSYPCYRPLIVVALILLGFSLVLTNYHFLGDVVAGVWCGVVITYAIGYVISNSASKPL